MKLLRLSGSLIALSILLAACGGGGGGGGSNPPVTTPTTAPGGGGGTPTPTSSPTGKPTPTPTPKQTPTPTPTPTPSGVPVDKNYALNAGVGPQVNPPPPQNNLLWYDLGTTAHWSQLPKEPNVTAFGDTSGSLANDANGFQPVDSQNCQSRNDDLPNTYAVHSFVAIYYNNGTGFQELQAPSGIGMKNPQEPIAYPTSPPQTTDYYQIQTNDCEYPVHTHDFSGLVHIVRNDQPQDQSPMSPFGYNLKSYFDIWGVTYNPASGITIPAGNGQPAITLSGPVAIYYGTQGPDKDKNGNYLTDSYVQVAGGDPTQVPLAWHDTAVIVIGNGFPKLPDGFTGIPSVSWGVEF